MLTLEMFWAKIQTLFDKHGAWHVTEEFFKALGCNNISAYNCSELPWILHDIDRGIIHIDETMIQKIREVWKALL
jgi:hypothetical protein